MGIGFWQILILVSVATTFYFIGIKRGKIKLQNEIDDRNAKRNQARLNKKQAREKQAEAEKQEAA